MDVPEETMQLKTKEHSADFFSNGYNKVEMNQEGLRRSELIAEKMIYYGDDDTTELTKPIMTFYNEDQSTWVIAADTGWISPDGKDLLLNGNVKIERKKASDVRPIHIKTTNLRVKPEKNYAETDEWVEIINPPDRTEGVGMQIYYTKPVHLKLLSKVRGRYEAN